MTKRDRKLLSTIIDKCVILAQTSKDDALRAAINKAVQELRSVVTWQK